MWKKYLFIFPAMLFFMHVSGQENIPVYDREQLEELAERKDADPNDDSFELDLESYRLHPLNLNAAGESDLIQLHLLSPEQILYFLSYRKLLGPLLTIRELQAVPGWDVTTIRKLLPYVEISNGQNLFVSIRERWKGGDEAFLIRSSQVLEKSKGYEKPVNPGDSHYEGSAIGIFLRYTYNYKNLLGYGFTAGKDAGEPFLRGAQRYGFDFYSFHFFLQHSGLIRTMAVGDFTINFGQGLIQWQTMAFTKSNRVMAIKRESSGIRPYRSTGEFNFHRGGAICIGTGKWQTTWFVSYQKISTNTLTDTLTRADLFSSFENSGYHRTPAEIADRNNSRQFSAGNNIRYEGNRFMAGVNYVVFAFSRPFRKRDEPYNLYSLNGKKLENLSLDYNYTLNNLHLFGEFASDQWQHLAIVQGALISLRENLDLSFLYRNISPAFQSLYSDAFTENSVPNNEKGLYMGIEFKPVTGMLIDFYHDIYNSPWLKYRTDAPSKGRGLMIQIAFQPNKSWKIVSWLKQETGEGNANPEGLGTHPISEFTKQRWRLDAEGTISGMYGFAARIEINRIKTGGGPVSNGYLGMAGCDFHRKSISFNAAAVLFETDNYDTRIYIYEPDMRFNFSLPVFYGRGMHYYVNVHKDISGLINRAGSRFRFSVWLKWSQTFYPGADSIGSGLDMIGGSRKSELKAQVLVQWQ